MFTQKKDKFYELLSDVAANVKETADFFKEYRIQSEADLQEFASRIKEAETKGDRMIHEIIKELHQTFITPIEREDILQLAMNLDDVLDGMEQTAVLFEIYEVTEPTDYMREFVAILSQCSVEMTGAIELLSQKKLPELHTPAVKLKEYESNCDELLRTAVRNLFLKKKNDPIKVIQYKEIYETLEEVADSYQKVADTFESIIMKNA